MTSGMPISGFSTVVATGASTRAASANGSPPGSSSSTLTAIGQRALENTSVADASQYGGTSANSELYQLRSRT